MSFWAQAGLTLGSLLLGKLLAPKTPAQPSQNALNYWASKGVPTVEGGNPYAVTGGGEAGGGGGGGGGGGLTQLPYNDGTSALASILKQLQGTSQKWYDLLAPGTEQASSYYKSLLSGEGLQQAIAPTTEKIQRTAEGTRKGLEAGTVRGGARDMALAEISRQKQADVDSVVRDQQPAAASALLQAGVQGVPSALTGLGNAGQLAASLGGLLTPPQTGGGGGGYSLPANALDQNSLLEALRQQYQNAALAAQYASQKQPSGWGSALGSIITAGLPLILQGVFNKNAAAPRRTVVSNFSVN